MEQNQNIQRENYQQQQYLQRTTQTKSRESIKEQQTKEHILNKSKQQSYCSQEIKEQDNESDTYPNNSSKSFDNQSLESSMPDSSASNQQNIFKRMQTRTHYQGTSEDFADFDPLNSKDQIQINYENEINKKDLQMSLSQVSISAGQLPQNLNFYEVKYNYEQAYELQYNSNNLNDQYQSNNQNINVIQNDYNSQASQKQVQPSHPFFQQNKSAIKGKVDQQFMKEMKIKSQKIIEQETLMRSKLEGKLKDLYVQKLAENEKKNKNFVAKELNQDSFSDFTHSVSAVKPINNRNNQLNQNDFERRSFPAIQNVDISEIAHFSQHNQFLTGSSICDNESLGKDVNIFLRTLENQHSPYETKKELDINKIKPNQKTIINSNKNNEYTSDYSKAQGNQSNTQRIKQMDKLNTPKFQKTNSIIQQNQSLKTINVPKPVSSLQMMEKKLQHAIQNKFQNHFIQNPFPNNDNKGSKTQRSSRSKEVNSRIDTGIKANQRADSCLKEEDRNQKSRQRSHQPNQLSLNKQGESRGHSQTSLSHQKINKIISPQIDPKSSQKNTINQNPIQVSSKEQIKNNILDKMSKKFQITNDPKLKNQEIKNETPQSKIKKNSILMKTQQMHKKSLSSSVSPIKFMYNTKQEQEQSNAQQQPIQKQYFTRASSKSKPQSINAKESKTKENDNFKNVNLKYQDKSKSPEFNSLQKTLKSQKTTKMKQFLSKNVNKQKTKKEQGEDDKKIAENEKSEQQQSNEQKLKTQFTEYLQVLKEQIQKMDQKINVTIEQRNNYRKLCEDKDQEIIQLKKLLLEATGNYYSNSASNQFSNNLVKEQNYNLSNFSGQDQKRNTYRNDRLLDAIQKEGSHLRGVSLFIDKSQSNEDNADNFLEQFINDQTEDLNLQQQNIIKMTIIIDTLQKLDNPLPNLKCIQEFIQQKGNEQIVIDQQSQQEELIKCNEDCQIALIRYYSLKLQQEEENRLRTEEQCAQVFEQLGQTISRSDVDKMKIIKPHQI